MSIVLGIIGIDFDDVLVDTMSALITYHNRCHGTTLTFEDSVSYDLECIFRCSRDELRDRLMAFHDSPEHDAILPTADAREALVTLRRSHLLHLVTARHPGIRERTQGIVSAHFGNVFAESHFLGAYPRDHGVYKSKSDVCREIGIRFFVDDALHHAIDVAKSDCTVLMPDKPWNQGELPLNVIRIFGGWPEITDRILKAAETAA